ncbi:MAG: hypothetical protein AAF316_00945 [Cyanobacteria bacterium P01_A01_bin.80]
MTETLSFLEETYPVYTEIQKLKQHLENLQTVEAARAEYNQLIIKEETKLKSLEEQKEKLMVEQRILTTTKTKSRPTIKFPKYTPKSTDNNLPKKTEINRIPKPDENNKNKLKAEAKKKFKRFLSRYYQHQLKTLGQINCIADDVDSPFGEALALLPWSIFEDYARRNAGNPERLNELGKELQEYRQQLSDKLNMMELMYRDCLGIWKKWRSREQSPENLQVWETFIAETRRAKQAQVEELKIDISQLEEKIIQIKLLRNSLGT